MIQKWLIYSIPLPSMIDDEFFEKQDKGSPIRPDGKPCIIAFIVKGMELYRILDDILVNLYLTPPGIEQQETRLTHILELDGCIQRWRTSLPLHLQNGSGPDNDPVLRRQALVLRIRLVILYFSGDFYINSYIDFYMFAFYYSGLLLQVIADAAETWGFQRIHITRIIQAFQTSCYLSVLRCASDLPMS